LAQQEQSTQNMSLGESLKAHFLEMSYLVIFFPDRLWTIRDETWENEGGLFPKHVHIKKTSFILCIGIMVKYISGRL